MKNIVIIDINTERKDQITLIGKPEGYPQPTNKEEADKMIQDDILCICEALITLINLTENKDKIYDQCIKHLEDGVKTIEN